MQFYSLEVLRRQILGASAADRQCILRRTEALMLKKKSRCHETRAAGDWLEGGGMRPKVLGYKKVTGRASRDWSIVQGSCTATASLLLRPTWLCAEDQDVSHEAGC
jgi:hypothetical protein